MRERREREPAGYHVYKSDWPVYQREDALSSEEVLAVLDKIGEPRGTSVVAVAPSR